MSAANLVLSRFRFRVLSWVGHARAAARVVPGVKVAVALALAFGLALTACHKDPPRRARRSHSHPAASAPAAAADDDSPPTAAPPAPAAAAVPRAAAPPAPAPPLPAPTPAPPPRATALAHHQLTVDRTVPSRPRAAAVVPAAAPEPAVEYRAVNDKPDPSARCQGGGATGERLSVQGVADNDVLNVREAPDKASAILGEIPPGATGVRGTPNRRRVGPSTWREVECGNLRGWVNERFLARDTTN